MIDIRAGDILLYYHSPDLIDRGIDFFEWFEHPYQPLYFYHAAVALSHDRQIEAFRHVEIRAIPYTDRPFMIFRPPICDSVIDKGLDHIQRYVGQSYDYTVIVDDALRYVSHNRIHLPVSWIESDERKEKDCSALVVKYLVATRMLKALRSSHNNLTLDRNASPEDLYILLRSYKVG